MGCRVLPPTAGSPRRRRCSSTMRERRLASRRGRQGTGSTRDLDPAGCGDRDEAQAEEPAQLAHARIALPAAAASRCAHGKPDLVAGRRPVDGLQHEVEGEGELQLADDHDGRLALAECHEIAAADLALDLVAELFEEALDRKIEARFQCALADALDLDASMSDSCFCRAGAAGAGGVAAPRAMTVGNDIRGSSAIWHWTTGRMRRTPLTMLGGS